MSKGIKNICFFKWKISKHLICIFFRASIKIRKNVVILFHVNVGSLLGDCWTYPVQAGWWYGWGDQDSCQQHGYVTLLRQLGALVWMGWWVCPPLLIFTKKDYSAKHLQWCKKCLITPDMTRGVSTPFIKSVFLFFYPNAPPSPSRWIAVIMWIMSKKFCI